MKTDINSFKFSKNWKKSGNIKPQEIHVINKNSEISYDDNYLKITHYDYTLIIYGIYTDTTYDKYGNILSNNFPLSEIHVYCDSNKKIYLNTSISRLDTPEISDCVLLKNLDTTKLYFNKFLNKNDAYITLLIVQEEDDIV